MGMLKRSQQKMHAAPGQSLGEYALIVFVMIMAAVAGLSVVGTTSNTTFNNLATQGFAVTAAP
jgi:Flp pilus assembly pilin Flp